MLVVDEEPNESGWEWGWGECWPEKLVGHINFTFNAFNNGRNCLSLQNRFRATERIQCNQIVLKVKCDPAWEQIQ
jgi:hypothetical protein